MAHRSEPQSTLHVCMQSVCSTWLGRYLVGRDGLLEPVKALHAPCICNGKKF